MQELFKSRPKSLRSNGLWNIALTFWTTASTLLITPFLIKHIGSSHYGLFILLMSISGLMGIMNFGLGEATLRYVAHYYAKNDLTGINRVMGATITIYIVSGLIGSSVLFLFSNWVVTFLSLPPAEHLLGIQLLRLTAVNFGLSFVGGVLTAIPQAMQRFDINTKILIAQSIFQVLGTVAIILNYGGIYELMLWSIATTLFTQSISVIAVKRLIPKLSLKPSPSRAALKEVFSYGIFSFITNVLGLIWGQFDRLLLGTFVGPSAVAFLSVPHQLSFRATGAVASAGSALFPRFTAMGNQIEITKLFLDATWTLLCATVVLFVPITILMPDFLRLWISDDFARQSAWVGQVIAMSCLVRGAFVPYDALFKGIGKPHFLSVLFFATAVTSLSLNLILIPKYGLAGAGYCYVATVLWGFAAIIFTCKKILHVASLRPLVRVVSLPIVLGFVCMLLFSLVRTYFAVLTWWGLISLGTTYLLLTAALVIGIEKMMGGKKSHADVLLRLIKNILPHSGLANECR